MELGEKRDRVLKRWHALVIYLTDNGAIEVAHDIEELDELHDLVERGPSFYSILSIIVTLNVILAHTVEQAARE